MSSQYSRKRNWSDHPRAPRFIRHAAVGLALAMVLAGTSRAALVTVSGVFTSFTASGMDRAALVNGTPLIESSTPGVSVPVTLATGTTRVDFTYDPLCCGATSPIPWIVNSFEYIAGPATDVTSGAIFQWGVIRFTNGMWFPQADIGILLTSHSSDPALDGHVFQGTVRLLVATSPPPFDPFVEADLFFLLERPDIGSGRVFDVLIQPPGNPGNVGDFALNGKIGSLIPTGFVALNAAGFTDPSVVPALSNGQQSAPEPGTMTLLGIGLLGAGVFGRRKSRR